MRWSEEIEARLATNQATYDNRTGELQAEANKLHNLKLDEERKRITKEFEASYAQTVEEAQQAIAAVRKQCNEQMAEEQALPGESRIRKVQGRDGREDQ